ncbi:MAG: serine/threonine protein kinase, partial [Actinobacteria bacterium]|nr:serine/threonine protein kinase [Actinomycetota bacterium]
ANAIAPLAATRMTADIAPQEVLDRLDPELVAPAVGYLVSEENEDTASVFVVGGGLVQRVAQFQNDGVTFSAPPSLADITAKWSQISDMSDAKLGSNPV